MTRDEFIQTIARFTTLDLVKAYRAETPTSYLLEMYPDPEKKTRTQVVHVFLDDAGEKVIAYSEIGPCPTSVGTLLQLLKENLDGYYSRAALLQEQVVQVYRYPLAELEVMELAKALDEVSRFADLYEQKYYGGVDRR